MNSTLPFLAISSNLETSLVLTVVGICIVFVVLFSIMIMLYLLRTIVGKKTQATSKAAVAAQAPSPSKDSSAEDQIDPKELAVICAAATVAIKKPFRIRRVKLISQDHQNTWRDHA